MVTVSLLARTGVSLQVTAGTLVTIEGTDATLTVGKRSVYCTSIAAVGPFEDASQVDASAASADAVVKVYDLHGPFLFEELPPAHLVRPGAQVFVSDRYGGVLYFSTGSEWATFADHLLGNTNVYTALQTFQGGWRVTDGTNGRLTMNVGTARNSLTSSTLDGSAFRDFRLSHGSGIFCDFTTKGFTPPQMTSTARDAISSPTNGLLIYNTTTNKHQGYNGSWNDLY